MRNINDIAIVIDIEVHQSILLIILYEVSHVLCTVLFIFLIMIIVSHYYSNTVFNTVILTVV